MPREARVLMKSWETLLDVCLNTHMACNGSGPFNERTLQRYSTILKTAIICWREELPHSKRFDDAVLELCKATLAELEAFDARFVADSEATEATSTDSLSR